MTDPKNLDPAEGSREVIDKELAKNPADDGKAGQRTDQASKKPAGENGKTSR